MMQIVYVKCAGSNYLISVFTFINLKLIRAHCFVCLFAGYVFFLSVRSRGTKGNGERGLCPNIPGFTRKELVPTSGQCCSLCLKLSKPPHQGWDS